MSGEWWRNGVIYQIYPRSFQDSNDDGIGDLAGLRRQLDYLTWLGIDALWVSPFYPSPMADFGYDVADYCNVDPIFGSLEKFDRLVAEAHERRLKVIVDFVPNHSSIEHPWFQESRRSRADPKRDWYIWRDPAPGGGPPNNWISNFGGGAWTLDRDTGQYYHHAFLAEQPDLNWRNRQVRAAMHDVMRFWLARGVDGFRVDVIWHLMKDAALRDNPPNPAWTPDQPELERLAQAYSADQPEVQQIIAGLRRVVDEFDDRVLIGEIYLPIDRLVAYYGEGLKGVHLPFNFHLLQTPWRAPQVAALIQSYEAALPEGAWPNWVLGNHDRARIAARVGQAQARMAVMLLLTLRGTPTLYYGDEIGIGVVTIAPEQIRDPWAKREPGLGVGRDPARTPMQWDASNLAGFSTHEPWLPLTDDHRTRNVAVMRGDPTSILTLTRALLQYRRARPALAKGSWSLIDSNEDLLIYERREGDERLFVALNFGEAAQDWALPAELSGLEIALSTHGDRKGESVGSSLRLRPDEGVIFAPP
ncbi:alpha-amylase family glycosyl hydrolase [Methylocapsa acidiphila]|uniref:alpha-amylase family glycosyl hydrolase n=1 Tax=Methylocapsa acidiphila TaxID=133552 RepID=UPI000412DBE8|nr:alpha-amylase family glycosyl hydrolase [Methylocapsa acidiphila]